MNVPIDQAERLIALDPQKSICVTAPAGSGKTELLSQRVLTLLARVDKPEEILAITFTRKAAAEMHHRIMQALIFARDNAQPLEAYKQLTWRLATAVLARNQACGWDLLDNPSRLKIQTIDSLCASLTRQMPLLSNFGAQPKITDSAELMYQQAVANLLGQLESDTNLAVNLELLFRELDNNWAKVESLLIDLLRCRDQWLFHIFIHKYNDPRAVLESALQSVVNDHIDQLRQKLSLWSAELLPLIDYAANCLLADHSESIITQLAGITELPGNDADGLFAWLAIAESLLTAKGEFRKSLNKNTGFPTQTPEGDKLCAKQQKELFLSLLQQLDEQTDIQTLVQELRYLPTVCFSNSQWHFLSVLTEILPYLVAELNLEFQRCGEVDHSQIAMAALQAMGDSLNPTELGLKFDYQLKHILIDEFQDTATTQFELLKRLLEGWYELNQSMPESPNTLFIVGDGMQSIYGFREANVGLFLEARRRGVNQLVLEDLTLKVNFRSSPTVVNWVNQTFENAFPAHENLSRGAVKYNASVAFNDDTASSRVKTFAVLGDDAREREAAKVVELVQQSMLEKPGTSIAILVRTRNHLKHILPALAAANISWQATDIDALANNNSIIDLLSLTKALQNRFDRIAWAAVLRAPYIGLDNADLHILLGAQQRQIPIPTAINNLDLCEGLSRLGSERIGQLREVLLAAEQQRGRCSLRVWVHGIWMALGGAACVDSFSDFLAVDDYFELLEQHEQQGQLVSFTQFESAVQRLYAAPQINDSCLQVMTIHKSKGLEFDTVILPALDRRPRSEEKALLMWREYLNCAGESQLLMSPLAMNSKDDSIYQYLRYEQEQSRQLENTRLLYVAATRAIDSLYLTFSQADVYDSLEFKLPNKQSLLSTIWPSIKDDILWDCQGKKPGDDQLLMSFEMLSEEQKIYRLVDDWRAPSWSFSNPLAEYVIEHNTLMDEKNRPDFFEDHYPRLLGNIIHKVLEQTVAIGPDYINKMGDEQKVLWIRRLCQYEGVSKERWRDVNVFIDTIMTNIQHDPKARWLLSSQHIRSDVEYELLHCNEEAIAKRVIDRLFIDEQGVRWIVDYKTSVPKPGQSLKLFIEQEQQEYSLQLSNYKALIESLNYDSLLPHPVKTALYFPAIPYWLEVGI